MSKAITVAELDEILNQLGAAMTYAKEAKHEAKKTTRRSDVAVAQYMRYAAECADVAVHKLNRVKEAQ